MRAETIQADPAHPCADAPSEREIRHFRAAPIPHLPAVGIKFGPAYVFLWNQAANPLASAGTRSWLTRIEQILWDRPRFGDDCGPAGGREGTNEL